MRTAMIKYLGIANVAQIKWCHQYFRFIAEEGVKGFRNEYLFLKKKGGEIFHDKAGLPSKNSGKLVHRTKLKTMNLFDFFKLFNCSLFIMHSYKQVQGCILVDEQQDVYFRPEYRSLSTRDSLLIERLYSDEFKQWKFGLMKKNTDEFFLERFQPPLFPWSPVAMKMHAESIGRDRSGVGVGYQLIKSERYNTIEKYFKYKNRIFIGVPDGVTDKFCYEFKSAMNQFWSYFIKPVGITQANLYSFFFKKSNIRVQIYHRDTGKVELIEQACDIEKAKTDLKTVNGLLSGRLKPIPPNKVKCSICEFRRKCRLLI
jgi:CRISPR/Cas system-associated exonuclease Cas4 (RecB family)